MMKKSEKQKNILHFLLLGERRFSDFKELGLNEVTLTRNLKTLESNNYISHNHLKKVYKITSKGFSFLNDFDDEIRNKIFATNVYYNIIHITRFWKIFDLRISDKDFNELVEHLLKLSKYSFQTNADLNVLNKMIKDFVKKYEDLKLEKVSNNEIVLRDVFYDILSSTLAQAILFISIKYLEENNKEVLNLLNSLPLLIASKIIKYEIPVQQIKDKIISWNLLDEYYKYNMKSTPEQYKRTVDIYENNEDLLLMDSIGGEFKENIEKRYDEFIVRERKILLDKTQESDQLYNV